MATHRSRRGRAAALAVACAALGAAVLAVALLSEGGRGRAGAARAAETAPANAAAPSADSIVLSEAQARSLSVGAASLHAFGVRRSAVGSIDFNENRSVQVFAPYQGKILQAYGDVGDEVAKGKTLFTIDSPDLIQAESALIAAAGVYELTSAALARARGLYETHGIAEKDMEQAVSDQQTAEAALKSARDAVRVFGKTVAEIDEMVGRRRIDPELVVVSPVSGRVTARSAQPGLLVQPGNPPAPFTISDTSSVWMIADVTESDAPYVRLGQEVTVRVMALPQRVFEGRVTALGETVDPNTHTQVVRSEVRDPAHELRPGMLAAFTIRTGDPIHAVGVPQNGVVREGDGTMSVWITTDRHRFTRRTVKIGLQQDGLEQVTEGLQPGELVVTDGAIFLSNMLNAPPDS